MQATILCSGPSLSLYQPGGGLVVAVNRAAILRACDVWCALDFIGEGPNKEPGGVINWAVQVQGSPLLLTSRVSLDSLNRRDFAWRGGATILEDFRDPYDSSRIRWATFSAPTAIVYAAHKGATHIDIYGMDLKGSHDLDGVNPSVNRSQDQWERQRAILADLIAFLAPKGITITRHTYGTD